MPRSSRRRSLGPNEQRQRELREQEAADNPVWQPPRSGEWWALAPSSVIHLIARVNNNLRVTYVVPMCGGRPSQARVEVPYPQLRDNESMRRHVCDICWTDPRAEGISIIRYGDNPVFSVDEIHHAISQLESF